MPLFVQAHYRFSTNEAGRPSTLYFQDMYGNRGRFRRGHRQGEQLIFQGRCRRFFLSPMLKGQVEAMTTGGVFEDNLDRNTYGKYMEKLVGVLQVLEAGDHQGTYRGRASLHPQVGWHVFDTNGNDAHCSAGIVMTADPAALAVFNGAGLGGYNGDWSIW
jgi:hypothetical protein